MWVSSLILVTILSPSVFAKSWVKGEVELGGDNSVKEVWIFKQWHLEPNVNTNTPQEKAYVQRENQESIYRQVEQWHKDSKIDSVFAEGCEGELDQSFSSKFNGWSYSDLEKLSNEKRYPGIVSHVPLKLEAKYKDKIKTICVDNLELVDDHNLAFSNARGALGFLMRIRQYKKDPAKLASYTEAAWKAFKWKGKPDTKTVERRIQKEVQTAAKEVLAGFKFRNKSMVSNILNSKFKTGVLVVGGAHAEDIATLLVEKKTKVKILEPKGYQQNTKGLLESIKSLAEKAM